MSAPAWLHFVGLCTPQDSDRLDALRREARRLGCSLRWEWKGNKWTGKSGIRMGQAQLVRAGQVLAYESSVRMPGDRPDPCGVGHLLYALEQHLAQIKSQDGAGKSDTPGG